MWLLIISGEFMLLTFEETEDRLLTANGSLNWMELGLLVNSCQHHYLWRNEYKSFTDWVTNYFCDKTGKTSASLWRYKSSFKYYLKLKEKTSDVNFDDLATASAIISAENLELIAKLERVAPESLFIRLSESVLNGTSDRYELRRSWGMFRNVLARRNSSGRGVTASVYDDSDIEQSKLRKEKYLLNEIKDNFFALLNNESSFQYDSNKFFINVTLEYGTFERPNKAVFDAVMVLGLKSENKLEFHGIEAVSSFDDSDVSRWMYLSGFCHYLWIVSTEDMLESLYEITFSDFGIIIMDTEGQLKIHRIFDRSNISAAGSGVRILNNALFLSLL
jgi:hypothetical protein